MDSKRAPHKHIYRYSVVRNIVTIFLLVAIIGSYLAFTNVRTEPVLYEPETMEWIMDESLMIYLEEFAETFEEGLFEEEIPGGAVVIVKEGRVVFQKGFGVKEKGTPDEVDEHTVFRLGSLSKGFTSVLAGA
ncbi:MAG: class A beta-lactamase-related serine hydrolase [Balneolaceae bacterium]|nr:MAG: class A beta-lactamase-related serine hydrolase [Balneolaceae bacterium]